MKVPLVVCVIIGVFGVYADAEETPIEAVAVLTGDTVNGIVHFIQTGCDQPVLIVVNVTGVNVQGFHIHETGDLSNGCLSLGAHYNPEGRYHGGPNDEERHIGDLGNVNGTDVIAFNDSLITLVGTRSIVGRGVIIHQYIDDLGRGGQPDSLTTGNAGPRVACGVIGYVNKDDPFECGPAGSATMISSTMLLFLPVVAFLLKK